jgi:hypothetical protein
VERLVAEVKRGSHDEAMAQDEVTGAPELSGST